ncbi:hypothetical protein PENTCL1PPCAC_11111, partial [Pristionchus entomophagus]
ETSPSRLLQAVTTAITNLLRNKLDASQCREYLRQIAAAIEAGLSIEDAGSGACAVFIISALQMVMEDRKRDGTLPALLAECCTLLNHSFTHLARITEERPAIKWNVMQSELAVIATGLMGKGKSEKSSAILDCLSVAAAIQSLHHLLDYSVGLIPNLFSPSSLSTYGVVLAASLEVYENEQWTSEIRLAALDLLKKVTVEEGAESLSCMIPGAITALHAQLTASTATANVKVQQKSLEIYARALTTVFTLRGDKRKEKGDGSDLPVPPHSTLIVKRDDQWWKILEERVILSITQISAALAGHRSSDVRLKLLTTVVAIWGLIDNGQSILDPTTKVDRSSQYRLQAVVIDLLLVMSEDHDERIASNCSTFLSTIPSSSLIDSCHEKLAEFASSLPVIVRNGDGDKQLFGKVSSVVRTLDNEIVFLAETEDELMGRFTRSLIDCIRIDATRLAIVRGEDEQEIEKEGGGGIKAFLLSLPLQFGMRLDWIDGVTRELARAGDHMLRLLLHLLPPSSSSSDDPSLLLVTTLLIMQQSSTPLSDEDLSALVEWATDRLQRVQVTTMEREETVEDASQLGPSSTLSALSLLSTIGVATSKMGKGREKNRSLITVLSLLLEWSACPLVAVSEAACLAIREIAKSSSLSVSALLIRNGNHIANRVALASRRYYSNRCCPLILSSLLDRLESDDLFIHLSLIVEDLIGALDRHNVDWCHLILRVLYAYIRAINRWYPDQAPPSKKTFIEEEETEKGDEEEKLVDEPPKPTPQKSVTMAELILKRTKHLHSSLHLPVCILSLSIASECLYHVRRWDDVLLPMVHQNWASLLPRFDDANYECRIAALRVLSRMAEVSKDFIHRKIKDDLWPSIESFLRAETTAKGGYEQSRKLKYTVALMDRLPVIFDLCALSSQLGSSLIDICTALSLNSTQSNTVIEAAKRAIAVLGHIDSRVDID